MADQIGLVIDTARLRLEPFSLSHASDLHILNSDPLVMQFIGDGTTRSLDETIAAIERIQIRWKKFGFSWWSIFDKSSNDLIGAACLQNRTNEYDSPFEVGWRLRPDRQGNGYATEAGKAILKFAFDKVGVDYLMAVTHSENEPSKRVMERLGMTLRGTESHNGRTCVVYEVYAGPLQRS